MSDELLSGPYCDLVRQVLAGEMEPEAAATEAVDIMEKGRREALPGFSLSFLGLSDADADRLVRFARAAEAEVIRRLASGPERKIVRARALKLCS